MNSVVSCNQLIIKVSFVFVTVLAVGIIASTIADPNYCTEQGATCRNNDICSYTSDDADVSVKCSNVKSFITILNMMQT